MNKDLMFSSSTDMWATPQDFFDKLNAVFRFEVDVCALPENAKCEKFFTPDENGLLKDWNGTCWMNPPYGRGIAKWIEKAYNSAKDNGATVVCLVPARVDTLWWHNFCTKGEVFFVKGRLKFGEARIALLSLMRWSFSGQLFMMHLPKQYNDRHQPLVGWMDLLCGFVEVIWLI